MWFLQKSSIHHQNHTSRYFNRKAINCICSDLTELKIRCLKWKHLFWLRSRKSKKLNLLRILIKTNLRPMKLLRQASNSNCCWKQKGSNCSLTLLKQTPVSTLFLTMPLKRLCLQELQLSFSKGWNWSKRRSPNTPLTSN